MFIFNLIVVFTMNFLKLAPIRVQDSSQEQDFTERNLLQHGSSTPKELLRFSEAALAWF
jgi:hypothetical protein